MVQLGVLHAGLLVLLHSACMTAATLQILQGRLCFFCNVTEQIYPVEGVATVELGEANQPIHYFYCSSTVNNGSGLVWTRDGLERRLDFQYRESSNMSLLDASSIGPSDLGVYNCIDTLSENGTMMSINITDANPAVCAVERQVGVVEGESVILQVYASSYPLLVSGQLKWYRPNGTLISSEEAELFDTGRKLLLHNVQSSDAGRFRCEASITISVATGFLQGSDTIQLDVYVPPNIIVHPLNTATATEFEDLTLTCSASASPAPTIYWERDGAQLPVNSGTSPPNISNGVHVVSVFTISSIRYNDRGSYRCIVTHEATDIQATSDFSVISVSPALLLRPIPDDHSLIFTEYIIVLEGLALTVQCIGSGDLIWTTSDGLQISSNSSNGLYQQSDVLNGVQSLFFSSFSWQHSALYNCQSDVTSPPLVESVFITSLNPSVYIAMDIQYVQHGASTTISATVIAHPSIDRVQWYHEGSLIDPSTNVSYSVASEGFVYSLTVEGLSEVLLGLYQVVVTALSGNASDTVQLLFYPSISTTVALTPSFTSSALQLLPTSSLSSVAASASIMTTPLATTPTSVVTGPPVLPSGLIATVPTSVGIASPILSSVLITTTPTSGASVQPVLPVAAVLIAVSLVCGVVLVTLLAVVVTFVVCGCRYPQVYKTSDL